MAQTKQISRFTPRQEMNYLRNSWSLVWEDDGWRVLPTKTVPISRDEEEIDIGGYLGRKGIEVFSIIEDGENGPRFEHNSYERELGFLGVSRVVHRSWAVTGKGLISNRYRPRYPILADIFMPVQSGQVLKIISRPLNPVRPHAETQQLVNVALASPQEYQDVFMVQRVCDTIEPFIGRLVAGVSTANLYTEGLQSAFAVPDVAS